MRLTTPNADEDMEHRNSHLLLVDIQHGTVILEDSFLQY